MKCFKFLYSAALVTSISTGYAQTMDFARTTELSHQDCKLKVMQIQPEKSTYEANVDVRLTHYRVDHRDENGIAGAPLYFSKLTGLGITVNRSDVAGKAVTHGIFISPMSNELNTKPSTLSAKILDDKTMAPFEGSGEWVFNSRPVKNFEGSYEVLISHQLGQELDAYFVGTLKCGQ